ncbi:FkbM family methyltransferase [bacterium]|nr:FkbM family methyltransferase [bacterium]
MNFKPGKSLKSRWKAWKNNHYQKKYNLRFVPPCYYILDNLDPHSIMVDVGTGNNADFSSNMIALYGLKSYGFDPTRKHHSELKKIEAGLNGKFTFYEYALTSERGTFLFHETAENISGSFLKDHRNVKNDTITSYQVKAITLMDIFNLLEVEFIDLLKLDVEGLEYDVLSSVDKVLLSKIGQLVVEFHHDSVERFGIEDTVRIIQMMSKAGFRVYTLDQVNYLFFK